MKEISFQPDVSVVIPVHGKGAAFIIFLQDLITELKSQIFTFEIVVIVDGFDESIVKHLSSLIEPNLIWYVNNDNRGKGYSLRRGIQIATSQQYIGYIDADGDIRPNCIVTSINALERNLSQAIAIGSKLHPESRVKYPLFRKLQSLSFSYLVRILFRLPTKDTQTGLKMGRSSIMKECYALCQLDGFAIDVEFLFIAKANGYKFMDVPVEIAYDSLTTLSFSSSLQALVDLFNLKFKLARTLNDV